MRSSLVFGLVLAAGCFTPVATPVPVAGDRVTLEGAWAGTYMGTESGRSGSITFRLEVGQDTAQGDVLMIPNWPGPNYISQYVPPDEDHLPQPLRIQMVRVFGHQVAGQLSPYIDPECNCRAVTVFSGRLQGDAIAGVFYTYRDDGHTLSGEWDVRRRP